MWAANKRSCPVVRALAVQPRFEQAGFLTADQGDGIGPCLDLICNGSQKGGTCGARRPANGPERGLGGLINPSPGAN
jgi:hypothetical protein